MTHYILLHFVRWWKMLPSVSDDKRLIKNIKQSLDLKCKVLRQVKCNGYLIVW